MIGFRKRVDVENVEAQAAKLTAATRKLDEALKAYQGAEEKFLEGTVQVIEATKKTGTFGAEEFKELCNSIRHYGNLRYLIIPFFLALQGAPLLALKDGTKLDIGFLKYGAMLIVLIILGVFYVL